jgi:hypothetical protein
MYFDLSTIQNIVSIAKAVHGNARYAYVNNRSNGVNKVNPGCRVCSACSMAMLYQFIQTAEYRQSEMYTLTAYQNMIAQLFECMSLQPEYYSYTGGSDVINATITPQVSSVNYWQSFDLYTTPAGGSTVIPSDSNDQSVLSGTYITGVEREGEEMHSNEWSVNGSDGYTSNGQITITTAANGSEEFHITYKKLTRSQ